MAINDQNVDIDRIYKYTFHLQYMSSLSLEILLESTHIYMLINDFLERVDIVYSQQIYT